MTFPSAQSGLQLTFIQSGATRLNPCSHKRDTNTFISSPDSHVNRTFLALNGAGVGLTVTSVVVACLEVVAVVTVVVTVEVEEEEGSDFVAAPAGVSSS
jgi:hypothetical protein